MSLEIFYKKLKEQLDATPLAVPVCESLIGYFAIQELEEGIYTIDLIGRNFLDLVDDRYKEEVGKVLNEIKNWQHEDINKEIYSDKTEAGFNLTVILNWLGSTGLSIGGNLRDVYKYLLTIDDLDLRAINLISFEKLAGNGVKIDPSLRKEYEGKSIYMIYAEYFAKELTLSLLDEWGAGIGFEASLAKGNAQILDKDKGKIKIGGTGRCSNGFCIGVKAIELKEDDGAFYYKRRIFKGAREHEHLINELPESLLAIKFE